MPPSGLTRRRLQVVAALGVHAVHHAPHDVRVVRSQVLAALAEYGEHLLPGRGAGLVRKRFGLLAGVSGALLAVVGVVVMAAANLVPE